jgi:soluble lytic murein transglycosylase
MTEGSSYADLEWLSGYLSLRYLNDPAQALVHFDRFAAAVDSPISQGRAGFWRGRTHAALGDANAAAAAYAQAAQHQTGFYGLLAAEELGLDFDMSLAGADDARDWAGSSVMAADLPGAALAFLAAGDRSWAVTFFAELGRTLPADDISRLAAWLEAENEAYFAVLLGKAAARRGVIVPSAYFPLHPLKDMDLPVPVELSLAIARRESEFNAGAGSPVGALGLMQLMPATAREVSGFLALPYAKSKLTSDWEYNAMLGSKYLSVLDEQFGYSPVQMAAGYNAGPSRPERWMDDFGDPRLGDVDVVDWIEHIPFRETRNYVMRVTETMPVYQARLGAEMGLVQFRALLIGTKPLIRPVARNEAAVPVVEDTDRVSTATNAPAVAAPAIIPRPSGIQGIRPISRPGG